VLAAAAARDLAHAGNGHDGHDGNGHDGNGNGHDADGDRQVDGDQRSVEVSPR
jgi:hypothetical protein